MSENWQSIERQDVSQAVQGDTKRIPMCSAHATTWVKLVGNFNSSTFFSGLPWDPHHPFYSASVSLLFDTFDERGQTAPIEIFFGRESLDTWAYHAVSGDPSEPVEIGSGKLTFNADGSLARWSEQLPLRRPSATGSAEGALAFDFGHSTESGADGMDGLTQTDGYTSIDQILSDGHRGVLGYTCEPGVLHPPLTLPQPEVLLDFELPASTPELTHCDIRPTTKEIFSGNLSSLAERPMKPWDPKQASITSNFAAYSWAVDAQGRVAGLEVYFRRESQRRWRYFVLLESTRAGIQLGSGELVFDVDGSLQRHREYNRLKLPGGTSTIELDFGLARNGSTSELGRVTSLPLESTMPGRMHDGEPGSIGQVCTSLADGWLAPSPLLLHLPWL